ncbi:putative fatty acyl-CoA reductase CG5065 [Amblyomma americanum]
MATAEYGNSQVADFYDDRVVFVTGGTGFIGKVLLEKLLRSCPSVKRVYVLVRCKRGEEPQARMEVVFNMPVFDRLKKEKPGAFEKVKVVAGDLTLPNLGLNDVEQAALLEEVSVVFHLGATVRFNEPFKRVVAINVLGTRTVLDLSRKMSKLCAFVHVSTAYSNWTMKEIDEKVYPPPVDVQRIIEVTRSADSKTSDAMREFSVGQPNSYSLAKAVTESMLLGERGMLPVAIVRPAIVTASWKEPFPGWVDNYNGCTGIVASISVGLLPSVIGKKKCLADLVPVDVVANMLICVAWQIATIRPDHLKVYNCTNTTLHQQTWGETITEIRRVIRQYPLPKTMFSPGFMVNSSQPLHNLVLFFLRYLPVHIGDIGLLLTRQKPRFVAQYEKVRKAMDAVQFYTTNSWLLRSENAVELISDLSPTDKQLFNFDIREMDWHLYWDQYMLGIHRFLLKVQHWE